MKPHNPEKVKVIRFGLYNQYLLPRRQIGVLLIKPIVCNHPVVTGCLHIYITVELFQDIHTHNSDRKPLTMSVLAPRERKLVVCELINEIIKHIRATLTSIEE